MRTAQMLFAAPVLLAALLSSSEGTRCTQSAIVAPPPLRRTSAQALRALRGGGEEKLKLHFSVVCDSTNLGEDVGVVGECEELGRWKNVVRMTAAQVKPQSRAT